jgi:hypothetical protein
MPGELRDVQGASVKGTGCCALGGVWYIHIAHRTQTHNRPGHLREAGISKGFLGDIVGARGRWDLELWERNRNLRKVLEEKSLNGSGAFPKYEIWLTKQKNYLLK